MLYIHVFLFLLSFFSIEVMARGISGLAQACQCDKRCLILMGRSHVVSATTEIASL